ncbi:Hsp20/alpha crystallin family protein [Nitrospira sp. Kam-Ns4a]
MELMSKIKEMIPWRRRPVETHEVVSLRDDINRLFDRFLASAFDGDWMPARGWWPGTEVEETEDEVIVRAEVPGLDPKDLDVTVRDGMLQIRYERREERRERAGNGGFTESRYGAMARTVALPDGLDTAAAKATCKHGLLTVRIPRTQEARQRVRRIPVQG